MEIKVCGLREVSNITEVIKLLPDYLGFIFYPHSKRYVGNQAVLANCLAAISNVKKVGVFVNATEYDIHQAIETYHLDFAQLHGMETPAFCNAIATIAPVTKAFHLHQAFDFSQIIDYENICSNFLFDTASPDYGGTGMTFDWTLLEQYTGSTPFFLSGGISIAHIERIKAFTHPMFKGIDINSRFETAFGIKDIQLLKLLLHEIRH